jgi:hypothetical protein
VMDGVRTVKRVSTQTKKTDRRGAQLSQECPPPINNESMGTDNRTAQCQLHAAACSDWAWLCK